MYDFVIAFCGEGLRDYPFLVSIISVEMMGVILFMFYTIVARVFRVIR